MHHRKTQHLETSEDDKKSVKNSINKSRETAIARDARAWLPLWSALDEIPRPVLGSSTL